MTTAPFVNVHYEILCEQSSAKKDQCHKWSAVEVAPANVAHPGHFCSQHIFHVKNGWFDPFDRLETP
jgi:hypothetical protein